VARRVPILAKLLAAYLVPTVATFAGSGRSALSDGDGQSAAIGLPAGLAAAPDGRLFLVDAGSLAVRALVTP